VKLYLVLDRHDDLVTCMAACTSANRAESEREATAAFQGAGEVSVSALEFNGEADDGYVYIAYAERDGSHHFDSIHASDEAARAVVGDDGFIDRRRLLD
jgi:hypothetical protein